MFVAIFVAFSISYYLECRRNMCGNWDPGKFSSPNKCQNAVFCPLFLSGDTLRKAVQQDSYSGVIGKFREMWCSDLS